MHAAAIREHALSRSWKPDEFLDELRKHKTTLAETIQQVLKEPFDPEENLEYNVAHAYRMKAGKGPVQLWLMYLASDWPKHSGWYAEPCKYTKDQPDCRIPPEDQYCAVIVMKSLNVKDMWAPYTYYGARQIELAKFILEKLENERF